MAAWVRSASWSLARMLETCAFTVSSLIPSARAIWRLERPRASAASTSSSRGESWSSGRRRTVAWYLWWVGEETGHVRKEAMVSRLHYMRNAFSDFDVPIALAPPGEAATPVAGGTPVT